MIINTKEISARIKLGIMVLILVYVSLLALSLIFTWSKTYIFEYSLTAIFVIIFIYIYIKKFCYVFFNNDGPKIIIRYIPLQPLSFGNYSIEISKKDFVKCEIQNGFFGLRKSLVVFMRTPQGVAKFKPVSLSILNKNEMDKLIIALDIV